MTHSDAPERHVFEPADGIPNNPLPLLIWRDRTPREARDGRSVCALYEKNGWSGTWVYTVYPFWHFHTLGHEVLACVSGNARIGFGGDAGIAADVSVGDVCIVPAGVGHKRLDSSSDFQMAGGYPPGQQGDIVKPGDIEVELAALAIAGLALPETDPITGRADGVVEIWRQPTD
jgi:uncharacterized protein YjlB